MPSVTFDPSSSPGRMEPLLQRIKEDRTAVLTPIIDVIDDKTLQYYNSNGDFFQVRNRPAPPSVSVHI